MFRPELIVKVNDGGMLPNALEFVRMRRGIRWRACLSTYDPCVRHQTHLRNLHPHWIAGQNGANFVRLGEVWEGPRETLIGGKPEVTPAGPAAPTEF